MRAGSCKLDEQRRGLVGTVIIIRQLRVLVRWGRHRVTAKGIQAPNNHVLVGHAALGFPECPQIQLSIRGQDSKDEETK